MATSGGAYKLNRMALTIRKMESFLPQSLHSTGYTLMFNNMVKLAGTAGIRIEELSATRAVVSLPNRKKVQNHIGGLHACSQALCIESATGILVGMNVPDTHLPLIKSMTVNFRKRCQGGVTATATLSEEDYRRIHEEERGDVAVQCQLVDESGSSPVEAEMIWAWVPKLKKK